MEQVKENNKKTLIITLIAIILIIVGIIIVATKGFNKELRYDEAQSIDVYIEKEFDKTKIKNIANEVLGNKNVIETIEVYEDMITVRAKTITEEQKDSFINKLKENYEFKQTAEETIIKNIAPTKFKDMYGKYVIPFIISGIIVLVYMAIRYYKIGVLKVVERTVLLPLLIEFVLLSIFAIAQIPMGRFMPVILILVYILSIMFVINKNEKDNDAVKEKEENE